MRKIDIRNFLQFIIKRKIVLQALLVVVMVSFLPGMVSGQTLEISCTNTTCYDDGNNDGSILVTITSATTGHYRYSISGPENISYPNETEYVPDLSYEFSDLPPGDYTITVIDNALTFDSDVCGLITITQPTEFTGITVSGWSCASSQGHLSITMTGGSPNYQVEITGTYGFSGTTSNNSYLLDNANLTTGPYTITVTDRCGDPQSSNYTLNLDNIKPECTTHPEKEDINNFDVSSFSPTYDNFYPNNTSYPFVFDGPPNSELPEDIIITGSRNYSDLQIQISASQSTGDWEVDDYLSIDISKDLGLTWEPVFIDYRDWNGIDETLTPPTGTYNVLTTNPTMSGWFNIGNPELSNDIIIRIKALKTDIGSYTVQGINVQGYDVRDLIDTEEPTICSDNYDTNPEITSNDGPITWYCNESDNLEFKFTRTWSIKDDCGNFTPYPQIISVSSSFNPYPILETQSLALTVPFCENEDVIIVPPTLSSTPDNCSSLSDITFEWRIYEEDDTPLNDWTNITISNTYDLPVAFNESQIFTVGWRITDQAGFSTIIGPEGTVTSTQTITLNPTITITLSRDPSHTDLDGSDPYDICSGSEAWFRISATGGNGEFIIIPTSPTATYWDWTGDDYGTYTTSGLTTAFPTITIQYQDTDGCPSTPGTVTFSSGGGVFNVRPNIPTGTLERVP